MSADEEYVHLQVRSGSSSFDMGARRHNYLLLTLARRRLADAADSQSEASCGWVHQEELEHDPAMASTRLNIDIFRIRQQFTHYHVSEATGIVERRRQTRELRLGTARVSIARL